MKTAEDFYGFLRQNGFEIMATGGGCTAWEKTQTDGKVILVGQDLHHEIFVDLLDNDWMGIEIGIYSNEDWDETVYFDRFGSIEKAMARLVEII